MRIQAGYTIGFQCPAWTPMMLQLNVHASRARDLLSPDIVQSDPPYAMSAHFDHFGNRVTRLEAPPGLVTFRNSFLIDDDGLPDEIPFNKEVTPISRLPDEVMPYLLASRYCDSDVLTSFAWSNFHGIWGGYARVRAICDFVHHKIRFSYADARSTRTASDALREGVGVCRDFTHLAVALCRGMNIPARYCTGYLGEIDIPPSGNPGDFSAWFEVFLDERWYTMDARHNRPRVGRILMARGRDAADVAISTAFGTAHLARFEVFTYEQRG